MEILLLLAFVALLACFYFVLGIVIPRLPLVKTRTRAALMVVASLVVFVLAAVVGMALEPEEKRRARETRREQQRIEYEKEQQARRTSQQVRSAEPPAATSQPLPTTTAASLLAEYANNEAAANARWEGKEALVTGTVNRVHQTFGTTVVELGSGGEFEMFTISCRLKSSELARAQTLNKGDSATVRGKVSEAAGFVSLDKCTFQ